MQLLATTLILAAASALAAESACRSLLELDYDFKACADTCSAKSRRDDCKYCKCMACGFCGAGAGEHGPGPAKQPAEPKKQPADATRHPAAPMRQPAEPKKQPADATTQPAERVLQAAQEPSKAAPHDEPVQQPAASPAAAEQHPAAAVAARTHEPQHGSRKGKNAATHSDAPPRSDSSPSSSSPSSSSPSSSSPSSSSWRYIFGASVSLAVAGALCAYAWQKRKGGEGSHLLVASTELEEGTGLAQSMTAEEAALVRRRFYCVVFLCLQYSAYALLRRPADAPLPFCGVFLCLQYSAYALLRRYATGILHERWTAQSVLGVGELLKFALSLGMIAGGPGNTEAPTELSLSGRLSWLLQHSAKMAVPALMYLTMNMLGFISLNRIDAGTFAVIQQSKIFFTALFQWMFFGRTLSQARMCALFTLVLGVLLISLEAGPSHSLPCPTLAAPGETLPAAAEDEGLGGYVLGIVAVTLDCLLSGLATVYFEKVLKTTSLTVWDRNLQLAFYSMLIYIPWSIYSNPANPLAGWSINTVVVALLGALGGILVALVIKYADGLAKNISTASSIVLTTAASHYLFDGAMNHAIIIGSMVVVASGYNYQNVP